MKKLFVKSLSILVVGFLFAGTVFAQDVKKETKKESKITIKVVKNGETVLDSTFVPSEGMDHEKIQKMIQKFSGDEVEVDWFDVSDEDFEFVFDGKTGHPHGKISKDHSVMIYKNENGEESEIVEIIIDGNHEIMSKEGNVFFHGGDKNMTKKGNVFFHGDSDKVHGNYKVLEKSGNVIMLGGEAGLEGNFEIIMKGGTSDNISWTSDENLFFGDVSKKKVQIELKSLGYDEYRLEFNSESLEPILIEVFDSEGKRQFKKKVKNFYGRFIKELELEGNEIPFFSVRVVQGDKEIIGEFEFK